MLKAPTLIKVITHSLTYFLTYSLTHSFTISLTYSLTYLLAYLLTLCYLDVSNILHKLGISHENEKVLDFGYIVDIFVEPHNFPQIFNGGDSSKTKGSSYSLASSLTYSLNLTHSLTHLLTHSYSLTHSLLLTHWLTHSLLLTHSLTHLLAGYIIEYDGPYHYETYLDKRLGPGLMKRRHLVAAGIHSLIHYFTHLLSHILTRLLTYSLYVI